MAQPSPPLGTVQGARAESVLSATVGTGEDVGGRNERAVVPIDRKRLAEADYGRVDFKRATRDDRRQRVA
jgi:hypothetical protein